MTARLADARSPVMGMLDPTVFVLGAGASMPYGLPSGSDLKKLVVSELREHSPLSAPEQLLLGLGFEQGAIDEFREDLADNIRPSIDAFLQIPAKKRYDQIARAAMAAVLLPYEHRACRATADGDWYRYLFNGLLPDDPSLLTNGLNLKVVTLNFDRTFEAYLTHCLDASFGVPRSEAEGLARDIVPVVQVHGSLAGDYSWSTEGYAGNVGDVRDSVNAIRVVGDDLNEGAVKSAVQWLEQAEVVCFLGFGFHEFVEERLQLERTLKKKKAVHLTHWRVEGARLQGIKARFQNAINCHFADQDVLTFLRHERLTKANI
jgi:hypothetical protein